MTLNQISIGIRTFLRDGKLFAAIDGIQKNMPEVKMIIADCGDMTEEKDSIYADLIRGGHTVIHLDYDAGFGAMSNRIAEALDRPYLLIGSDDFDFRPPKVREGIENLLAVLENTNMDVVSGRVGQHGAYEFDLEEKDGVVTEHRVFVPLKPEPWYVPCDLTVNYCLCKSRIFNAVRWDDDVKIGGGEHGSWFLDLKRAGFKVAYVPGVSIQEQKGTDTQVYRDFRMRSQDPRRPCFDRRGVRKYILGGGQVDYDAKR